MKKKKIILFLCLTLCLSWINPNMVTKAAKNTTVSIATDDLNVRSGPGLHYDVVTTLKKGKEYPLIKEDGDWLQIGLSKEEKGWVANYLVTKKEEDLATANETEETEENEQTNSAKSGIITVDSLNVRSDPSLNSNIIGKLGKDTMVELISEASDWVEIGYEGKSGWVSNLYIADKEDSNLDRTSNPSTLSDSVLTILHNGTNIRQSPNTESTILERANEGDTFKAITLENDWYAIMLADGQPGYVASWLVSVQDSGSSKSKVAKQGLGQYLQNKKIVIDPGHGGKDDGTTGTRGTLEKKITMQTANHLYQKLKAAGADVILTRDQDKYLSLPFRVGVASFQDADAFISIHYDSIKNKNVSGLTTYFYHSWQRELAVDIHSAVIEQTEMKDRGVRHGDYYVIRENTKKAVLIELGYLSNPTEELLVTSDQYQESAATGIYEGLARYFKEN